LLHGTSHDPLGAGAQEEMAQLELYQPADFLGEEDGPLSETYGGEVLDVKKYDSATA